MKDRPNKENDELRMMNMLLEADQDGKDSLSKRLFGGDGFGWMVFFVILAVLAAASLMLTRIMAPELLGETKPKTEKQAVAAAKPPQVEPPKAEQVAKVDMKPIVVEETDEQKGKKIVLALEDWAKAWSAKDLEKYFAAYAPNFQPTKGVSRQAWEADRKAKISSKTTIKVQIKDAAVKLDGSKALVTLTQNYQADEINATGKKVFDMVQEGDRWLIQREANQ